MAEPRAGAGGGSGPRSARGGPAPGPARALGWYALATFFLTWPIAVRAWQRLPEHASDIWIFLWNDWWLRTSLGAGGSLYRTPFLFYPTGVSLAFHSHSQLTSALNNLLAPLTGGLAAYNFSILLIFVLGAWGMYLLARELTGSEGAAFVAGLVYAFAPYHLTQALAHPNLASVQWYPFMALFLRRAMLRGSARDGALGGLFFAASVWSGLHLGHLGGLWAAAFVLYTLATEPAARARKSLTALAASAAVAIALSLPVLVPVARELRAVEGGLGSVSVEKWETFQTDPVAWFVPPLYHPVFGRFVTGVYDRFDRNDRWMPYLGFLPLALALWAALRERRAARFWWASGLLWMLLSMGTFLRFNGTLYPSVPLPFALIGSRFPFSTLRSSDRFNILVPLSLAVLVALALARVRRRRLVAVAGAVIVFEFLCVPIPTGKPPDLSPFFARMAADGAEYGVVDLPMDQVHSKTWMYFQTFHHKPIVEGHVSRVPPHAYDFIEGIPLLRAFRDDANPPPDNAAADLCRLERARVRYILMHLPYAEPELGRWSSWLAGPPLYRDEHLLVYTTDGVCEAQAAGRPPE